MDHLGIVGGVKELIFFNIISIFSINILCVFIARIISAQYGIIY
jgi:hypothetical protein